MSDEVDKVLARGIELSKPLGRVWTVVVLLFSVWAVRKRPGLWTASHQQSLWWSRCGSGLLDE